MATSNEEAAETVVGRTLATFAIVDENVEGGVTREKLGRLLLDNKASGFTITILERDVVHGLWKKDNPKEGKASLLIFHVKAHDSDRSRGRRFKNIRVGIRFASAKENAKLVDDPRVACYGPAQSHDIGLIPTAVLREKKRSREISIDVDANPAPVTFGLGFTADDKFEYEKHVCATISTRASQEPYSPLRKGEVNFVEWTLGENKYEKLNLNSIDIAVLLRRRDDSPFLVDFSSIDATVDTLYTAKVNGKRVKNALDATIKWFRGFSVPFGKSKHQTAAENDGGAKQDEEAPLSKFEIYYPAEQQAAGQSVGVDGGEAEDAAAKNTAVDTAEETQGEGETLTGVDPDNLWKLQQGKVIDNYAFYHILDVWRGIEE